MRSSPILVPAERVAKAVVKAVVGDRAELVLMPGPGRLIKALLDLYPNLGSVLNRASGTTTVMTKVIEFREAKRHAAVHA